MEDKLTLIYLFDIFISICNIKNIIILLRSLEHLKQFILKVNLHSILKMGNLKTRKKKTVKIFSKAPPVDFL